MTITRRQQGDYVAVHSGIKAYGYTFTEAIINCMTLATEPQY